MPWAAVLAGSGCPAHGVWYPKLSLNRAFRHRLEDRWRADLRHSGDCMRPREGQIWEQIFTERDCSCGVVARYICLEEVRDMCGGALFEVTYLAVERDVQWVHLHFSHRHNCVRATDTEFVVHDFGPY